MVISEVRRTCLVCGLMLLFIILRSSLKSAISIQSAASADMELYDTDNASFNIVFPDTADISSDILFSDTIFSGAAVDSSGTILSGTATASPCTSTAPSDIVLPDMEEASDGIQQNIKATVAA